MAGVQVLRIESRPTLDVGLVRHIVGESRPETARDVAQRVVDLGGVGLEAGRAAILAAAPTGRGRRPNHAVEFLLAGAPPYGPDEWSEEREREFAQACYDWARDVLGPRSVIVSAAWHRDETSPHVHVLAIPIDSAGKLRWKGVRDEAANRLGSPRSARGGQYRVLQDHFHAAVASRYDLGRGEIGSQATHAEIDRAKAAERRREVAEYAAATAERATATAREKSREVVRRHGELHDEAVELVRRRRDRQVKTAQAEREFAAASKRVEQARALEAYVTANGGIVRRAKRHLRARSRVRGKFRQAGVVRRDLAERVQELEEKRTRLEEDVKAHDSAQAALERDQTKAQAILGREGTLVDGERQLAAAEATAQTRTEELEDREAKAQAILDREAALEDGERRFEPRSAALKKREQEIEKESSRLDEGVQGLGAEREAHNSAKKALEREQEALQGDQEALKRDQTTAQAIVAREEALKDDERRLEEKRTDVENEEAAVKARSAKLEKREEEANDRDREQDENAENLNDYYDWLVKRSTSLDEHQADLKESFDELTTATPRVNRILATAEARTKLLLADAEIRWTAAGGGEELGRAAAKWVKGKYGSDAENALLRELGRVNRVLAEPIFTLPPDVDPFARVDLKLPAKPPAKLPAVPELKAGQRRAPGSGVVR